MTRFTKGHGTENDFVLVPDLDGAPRRSTPDQVRRLADRHAGHRRRRRHPGGADRARRRRRGARAGRRRRVVHGLPQRRRQHRRDVRQRRRASSRPTCGARGWSTAPTSSRIATRAGVKRVRFEDDGSSPSTSGRGGSPTTTGAAARRLRRHGARRAAGEPCPALSLDLGNPHAVVALPEGDRRSTNLDLDRAPRSSTRARRTAPTSSSSAPIGPGHIAMRVHERGVGETRSCGTGAAAAALATRFWAGVEDDSPWTVDVPGGRARRDARCPGSGSSSPGPPSLVADGDFRCDPAGGRRGSSRRGLVWPAAISDLPRTGRARRGDLEDAEGLGGRRRVHVRSQSCSFDPALERVGAEVLLDDEVGDAVVGQPRQPALEQVVQGRLADADRRVGPDRRRTAGRPGPSSGSQKVDVGDARRGGVDAGRGRAARG